jgi:hypothetical protein
MPSNPLRFHVNEISVPLSVYATTDAMHRAMSHVPPANRPSLWMRTSMEEVTVYDDGEVVIVVDTYVGKLLLTTREERIRASNNSRWAAGPFPGNAIRALYLPPNYAGPKLEPLVGQVQLAIKLLDGKEMLTGELELRFHAPPDHPAASFMPENPLRIRVPRIYAPTVRRSAIERENALTP